MTSGFYGEHANGFIGNRGVFDFFSCNPFFVHVNNSSVGEDIQVADEFIRFFNVFMLCQYWFKFIAYCGHIDFGGNAEPSVYKSHNVLSFGYIKTLSLARCATKAINLLNGLAVQPSIHHTRNASAKSDAGIETPQIPLGLEDALIRLRLFLCHNFSVYGGPVGKLRLGRFLGCGSFNPLARRLFEIETSLVVDEKSNPEETFMSNSALNLIDVDPASLFTPLKPMKMGTLKDQDVSHWLVSEKLDGVRALWDGEFLYSQNGNLFYPPQWFTDGLPNKQDLAGHILDGELWIARGCFDQVRSIARKKSRKGWQPVLFRVFDVSCGDRFDARFSSRYARYQYMCAQAVCPWLQAVEQTAVRTLREFKSFRELITYAGGEGVVVRTHNGLYTPGKRVSDVLKDVHSETCEVRVVTTVVNGLLCQTDAGERFTLSNGLPTLSVFDDGCSVTISHAGFTRNGVPRNAKFKGVRDYE